MSQPLAVPSRTGDKPGDDAAVRDRIADIARRSAGSIIESVRELGLVQKVDVAARVIPLPIFDAVGKDTVLRHHSVSDDDRATGSQYVDQARRRIDSLWGTLGRTYEP